VSTNDITGDRLVSRSLSQQGRDNFDLIFKKNKMDFNKYQREAMSFRLPSANHDYALLGLSGEVGELHSAVAKAIRDGKNLDMINVGKELGDILWFVAALADDYGFDLNYIAQKNIEKLSTRKCKGTLQGSGDDR